MTFQGILHVSRHVLLLTLVVCCAYTDLASKKLYNSFTLPALALGLCLNAAIGGIGFRGMFRYPGLAGSVAALAAGGLIFLWFYMRGGVTGGDVKYVSAVCAIGGLERLFSVYALFLASLVGAVMALAVLIWKGRLWSGLKHSLRFAAMPAGKAATSTGNALVVPYGLAISLGTLWAWFLLYYH